MERESILRRNAHALDELYRRGAIKGSGLPPGLRLTMKAFPTLRVPYYGDRLRWTLILGLLFGLPFGGIFALIISFDPSPRYWLAWLVGVGGGALFGLIFTGFMVSVHRRLRLTAWDDLDAPAGEAPADAEDYEKVEAELLNRMSKLYHIGRRMN